MQSPDPLESLNPQQREAATHGTGDTASDTRPLLVIAGAGSGKTNTLAHRVANLIRHGADPQRMMLLTFSRRAAQELERRVGGVLQQALGLAGTQAPALPWSGTFHGIGARLLREYAARIGLEESFTIHDRGDAEDLMGLVRHEIGFSDAKKRFPLKGTCLGIYSRVLNTCDPLPLVLQSVYPWCAQWEDELKKLFGAYVEAKQQQNVLDYDDLLAFWADMMAEPHWRRRSATASTTCWWTNTRTPTACRRTSCWRSSPRGRASRWWATTRRASTPFAAPRCATSSTSRTGSRSPRARSRWSATTAARSRSWTRAMQ
jgi:DNA helicase-2/ATP-dependent DNA helicase PcrA